MADSMTWNIPKSWSLFLESFIIGSIIALGVFHKAFFAACLLGSMGATHRDRYRKIDEERGAPKWKEPSVLGGWRGWLY
jgi:hypothetical protein